MFCVCGFALGQAAPAVSTVDQLRTRALAVLQAERARAKQPMCAKAATTPENNECYGRELKMSDGNYVKLVRALGAFLRGVSDVNGAPGRIPFDDGETAWSSYREVACKADASRFEGGTIQSSMEMGCEITLVRSHMEELWKLYSNAETE